MEQLQPAPMQLQDGLMSSLGVPLKQALVASHADFGWAELPSNRSPVRPSRPLRRMRRLHAQAAAEAFLGFRDATADSSSTLLAATTSDVAEAVMISAPLTGPSRVGLGPATKLAASFLQPSPTLRGDFDGDLCGRGESVRLGPDGLPFFVDLGRRHDLQLDVAVVIGITVFVLCSSAALSWAATARSSDRSSDTA